MPDLLAFLGDSTVLIVGAGAVLLGGVAGGLGAFAVLRRQSLLGDAMAHAALPGVVVGYLVSGERSAGPILAGALVSGLAAGLAALHLSRLPRIKSDAALGVSLSLGFALGVVLLTRVQGSAGGHQAGLEAYLFGQAAATLRGDLLWLAGAVVLCTATMVVAWRPAKLTTFDREYAAASQVRVRLVDALLTGVLALTIVLGLRMVGVVLMAALVVAPAVAARQWSSSLLGMVLGGAAIGAGSALSGALISASAPGLATGPLIVVVASAVAGVALLTSRRESQRA